MPCETLPAPHAVQDTGIRRNLLEDLALKIVYLEGEMSLRDLAERLRLSLGIVEALFQPWALTVGVLVFEAHESGFPRLKARWSSRDLGQSYRLLRPPLRPCPPQ